jgi:UDP:flavonoid glycosyltransferase YjiC (YdhE family)
LGHPQQRGLVESAGLRFEPYRHARPWSPNAHANGPQWALKYLMMFTSRAGGVDLVESARREPVDVAVIDCMMLGALKAAQDLGIRRAALVHTLYRFMTTTWSRGPIGQLARLKSMPPAQLWRHADLNLLTSLPELEDPAPLPANAQITGPVWPVGAPPPQPHTADEPRILVSLSSIHYVGQTRVIQSIMDAVADLPAHVILTTGHGVAPDAIRTPANVEVHQFLPHWQVMPIVSLVVGHAGHSTTMQALAHDLPLVLIPMSSLGDQPAVARAVAGQGAATVVNKTAPPPQIKAAIQRMLGDGPHRAAAARLGQRIRQGNGATAAADEIERLTRPTQRDDATSARR